MSFDISKLTNAVNRYLNSISDIAAASKQAALEAEERNRFSSELSDAIKQNINAKTRDIGEIPDIAAQVQSEVKSVTSGIDVTIEQINGAFESIREAGAAGNVRDKQAASKTASETSPKSLDNRDAYSGFLSTEALQELSKSQYFSSNLIQSSLFNENSGEGTTDNGDNEVSLSDLNAISLENAVAGSDLAKALIKAYTNTGTAAETSSIFGDFTL